MPLQINIVKIDNHHSNIMHQSTVNSCSSTEANNIQLDQNLINMQVHGKVIASGTNVSRNHNQQISITPSEITITNLGNNLSNITHQSSINAAPSTELSDTFFLHNLVDVLVQEAVIASGDIRSMFHNRCISSMLPT